MAPCASSKLQARHACGPRGDMVILGATVEWKRRLRLNHWRILEPMERIIKTVTVVSCTEKHAVLIYCFRIACLRWPLRIQTTTPTTDGGLSWFFLGRPRECQFELCNYCCWRSVIKQPTVRNRITISESAMPRLR
jgi:hypothetical protein